jgi:hypothetical protein
MAGEKYVLKTVKGTYTEILTEKCEKVNPIPCPDEVDEQPFLCALLPCSKQKELCECYELEVGKSYYFVTVDKKGRVLTYKVLVTSEKTDILEILLTLPPCGTVGGE